MLLTIRSGFIQVSSANGHVLQRFVLPLPRVNLKCIHDSEKRESAKDAEP
jgi:hypothetical protein